MNNYDRLMLLWMVLKYDSYINEISSNRILTSGHRILINQERAFLMYWNLDEDKKYEQSSIVNKKIEFILDKIHRSNLYQVYAYSAESILKD